MGRSRRGLLIAPAAVVLLAAGCGDAAPAAAPPIASTSVSTTAPAGAMAGFLTAAATQDNSRVTAWLATTADAFDLSEIVKVYSNFGNQTAGGLFWEVTGVHVTRVDSVDATHAEVALNSDIVWCLGRAANDPAAACSAVAGLAGKPHTYAAVAVDGSWKVDIDINASSQLDHNPEASPTASAPTPTPSPT